MAVSKLIATLIDSSLPEKIKIEEGEKIKVNTVISKAAYIYENVRTAIDYNEEHLIRKNAIYRILKRKLVLEKMILENYLLDKFHQDEIARQLLQELIRGRYLENNVPVKLVGKVDGILSKYSKLLKEVKEKQGRVDHDLFNFLLEMQAVEIESAVIPQKKEKAAIRAMFSVMNPRVTFVNVQVDEKEKEMQVYLGVHRALYKWDDAMIHHLLLNLYYPAWKNADENLIAKIASKINKVKAEIEKQTNHPWRKNILKLLQKQAIVFWIMQDVIEANPEKAHEIFSDKETLTAEVQKACEKRYKQASVKLRRGVVRSIVYVFFTKMILALAIEFPADIYLSGAINYVTAVTNILFPPVLMFLVAILIRLPRKENTEMIVKTINEITFDKKIEREFKLKDTRKQGKAMRFVFNSIYGLTFIFSLMVLFSFLHRLGFNVFSSLIFILFLTLVSFFGIRIRRPIKDLMVIDTRDSLIGIIVDFFALPFVSMGRIMSEKFSKLNVIAFFMDIIIEAPFKLLIELVEDLFSFLREKKEDVLVE
ncbi:hypothetical protein KKC32_04240 [Patescibacteria group bacterium]|nr:hypothetical protein [Patescibacteria group bacterium]